MTNNEYNRLYRQARQKYAQINQTAIIRLRKIYTEAGRLVAAELRQAELAGVADSTLISLRSIQRSLSIGAEKISVGVESALNSSINAGLKITSDINKNYVIGAMNDIDFVLTEKIKSMYTAIDRYLLESIANRVYQDGYTLSERVWRTGLDYQNKIKNIISAGIAQGRDAIKIARDIQAYIKAGKKALINRFGNLTRGAADFMSRIGDRVDYNALRLIRSELYASLQEASIKQGLANPGTTDLYFWIMELGRQHWNCACPTLSANSPYALNDVPGYPHPQCRCQVRPQLRDRKKFVNDLKKWADGNSVGYLDDWYNNQYKMVV